MPREFVPLTDAARRLWAVRVDFDVVTNHQVDRITYLRGLTGLYIDRPHQQLALTNFNARVLGGEKPDSLLQRMLNGPGFVDDEDSRDGKPQREWLEGLLTLVLLYPTCMPQIFAELNKPRQAPSWQHHEYGVWDRHHGQLLQLRIEATLLMGVVQDAFIAMADLAAAHLSRGVGGDGACTALHNKGVPWTAAEVSQMWSLSGSLMALCAQVTPEAEKDIREANFGGPASTYPDQRLRQLIDCLTQTDRPEHQRTTSLSIRLGEQLAAHLDAMRQYSDCEAAQERLEKGPIGALARALAYSTFQRADVISLLRMATIV